MKRTKVINLFGAPNSGKSTLAAELFTYLKKLNFSCELVREYVKTWAWENKQPTPLDQVYLLAKQVRSESMLYNKVDYIVTDSPILLVGVYQTLFFDNNYIQVTAKEIMKEAREKYNVSYLNYILPKRNEIQLEGRFHTEDEISKIDLFIPIYLNKCNEPFILLNETNQLNDVISKGNL